MEKHQHIRIQNSNKLQHTGKIAIYWLTAADSNKLQQTTNSQHQKIARDMHQKKNKIK